MKTLLNQEDMPLGREDREVEESLILEVTKREKEKVNEANKVT